MMNKETCFVVMPIGEQVTGDGTISQAKLRERFTHLIKEAIETARPGMDVVRADDVYAPGGISNDIYTRLMHSDFVVADITFPNPNVFYELGIRHACRCGTILIKEKNGQPAPFDVAGQRYIQYDNTPRGLELLSVELRKQFDWLNKNPKTPDNNFQELAKFTQYRFPFYAKITEESFDTLSKLAVDLFTDPKLKDFFARLARKGGTMDPADNEELFLYLRERPNIMQNFFKAQLFFKASSI